jgi:chromosome segregation ATPase
MKRMSDLFKKLNVLIRSSLSEVLRDDGTPRQPLRLGKDIDREIAALRQRINDAVSHEERLKGELRAQDEQIARWDGAADDAVRREADDEARRAIDELRKAKRRRERLEADLREHEMVTGELIQRVNLLEAVVADARRAQAGQPEPVEETAATPNLSNVLREARQQIAALGELIARPEPTAAPPASPPPVPPAEDLGIEDDLAKRRQRLSRR